MREMWPKYKSDARILLVHAYMYLETGYPEHPWEAFEILRGAIGQIDFESLPKVSK